MKLPFHPADRAAARRPSRQGIALVITLILLSVTAFLTFTFLILSQRERGAVSVAANQTDARFAAETAVQRATTRLLAPVISFNDGNAYDLLVSTNYINPVGFISGAVPNQFTNVSYTYANGSPLNNLGDVIQNLTNLLYDPRPPVYITNKLTGANDFRFYLDLNRNGLYDTNGYQPVMSTNPTQRFMTASGALEASIDVNTLSNYFTGDPEWIGVLERPELPHSANNRFIARYAYIALPAGKTLDLNYAHNYATRNNAAMTTGTDDGFLRNQGVGTWEINLAAFLTDLNTNLWPGKVWSPQGYYYDLVTGNIQGNGSPFDDALSLLRYRYNGSDNNLPSVASFYGANPANSLFKNDNIDEYSDGPLATGVSGVDETLPANQDDTTKPWSGADNPVHYFTPENLFDGNKTSANFTNRLYLAGTNLSSYDRYTFYRMLAQLGTDTAPEQGKINVNYANVDANGNIVPNMETNYLPWNPQQFFTNVAPRLLTNYFGAPVNFSQANNLVCLTTNAAGNVNLQFHIQIYPTNYYTPAVHRLLQLAANIYDATTNNAHLAAGEPRLPTVFRPVFNQETVTIGAATTTYIWITNYVEEVDPRLDVLKPGSFIRDVNNQNVATDTNSILNTGLAATHDDNVYGIPLIIGARKGLPNFNEFAARDAITATRKLQFVRGNWPALTITQTNVMYTLSISNVLGVEAWNSYVTNYPRPLQLLAVADLEWKLMTTNGTYTAPVPVVLASNRFVTSSGFINLSANTWKGYDTNNPVVSFQIPLFTNATFLTNSTYSQLSQAIIPLTGNFEVLGNNNAFPVPRWWFYQKTRVRYVLLDTSVTPNRIVDYASLSAVQDPIDITYKLMNEQAFPIYREEDGSASAAWATNRVKASVSLSIPTVGIINQVMAGKADKNMNPQPDWKSYLRDPAANDVVDATVFFADNLNSSVGNRDGVQMTNVFYAPYDPTLTIYQHLSWQANDPLVHYLVGDLLNTNKNDLASTENLVDFTGNNPPLDNLTNVNNRYQPWGQNLQKPTANLYNLAVKDPLVGRSDDWQFPTNKLPGAGWLGRVHRGTPWQTVYLKSQVPDPNAVSNWVSWEGDNIVTNLFTSSVNTGLVTYATLHGWHVFAASNAVTQTNLDAMLTMPTNDWQLFDLLTATPNDNATRGQLSVNQTNLAAWSAVLGGVLALDSSANPVVIQPAGQDPTLRGIVNAINDVRNTNYNGSFNHLGEVLSVPQLTLSSPYLGTTNGASVMSLNNTAMSDAVVERIPQQVLSLLRGKETRFVIYAYGQSLKPADRSILSSGICTNYQITGETAVRAVIRVDGSAQNPRPVVESFNYLSPND
jgi:hypothetical protein